MILIITNITKRDKIPQYIHFFYLKNSCWVWSYMLFHKDSSALHLTTLKAIFNFDKIFHFFREGKQFCNECSLCDIEWQRINNYYVLKMKFGPSVPFYFIHLFKQKIIFMNIFFFFIFHVNDTKQWHCAYYNLWSNSDL